MSVNPNQSFVDNVTPLFVPSSSLIAGIYSISSVSSFFSVTVPGVGPSSVVVATYCHPGATGAAGQAFYSITPCSNVIGFDLQQVSSAGESINYIVKS